MNNEQKINKNINNNNDDDDDDIKSLSWDPYGEEHFNNNNNNNNNSFLHHTTSSLPFSPPSFSSPLSSPRMNKSNSSGDGEGKYYYHNNNHYAITPLVFDKKILNLVDIYNDKITIYNNNIKSFKKLKLIIDEQFEKVNQNLNQSRVILLQNIRKIIINQPIYINSIKEVLQPLLDIIKGVFDIYISYVIKLFLQIKKYALAIEKILFIHSKILLEINVLLHVKRHSYRFSNLAFQKINLKSEYENYIEEKINTIIILEQEFRKIFEPPFPFFV